MTMGKHAELIQDDPSLSPVTWLCVTDVTDGHAMEGFKDGRALDADGKEVLILVVTSKFERKSMLQRQRMINTVLFEDLNRGALHSVRMRCLTPAQWEMKGRPQSFHAGKPCSMLGSDTSGMPSMSISSPPRPSPSLCVCGDHSM